MDLNLEMMFNMIPIKDLELCKNNRSHMIITVLVDEDSHVFCARLGTNMVKMNSVYVAKIDGIVCNFTFTNDQQYINKDDWSQTEIISDIVRSFKVRLFYNYR